MSNDPNNTSIEDRLHEEAFLHVIDRAILNAVHNADTQIVYDGEEFHAEEINCDSFIRGYVIRHNDYLNAEIPEGNTEKEGTPNAFQTWLAEQYYLHANKCCDFFLGNRN